MANNDHNDKELNDYLNGDSDLSKAYRAQNNVEPSVNLDEKILTAAKEAVRNTDYEGKPHFHKSPWTLPVSIAAMITLSVSLVVTMQQETGQPLISEPEVEMFDSAAVIEESAMSVMTSKGDSSVTDEIELKQNKDGRDDAPAPAALGATADIYRAEEKTEAPKARMKALPAKKTMLKEKARSDSQILEKRQYSDDKIKVIETEQIGFDDIELDAMTIQSESDELKIIKKLWDAGEFSAAKQVFKKFKTEYPDITEERIKESLGANLYNELLEY